MKDLEHYNLAFLFQSLTSISQSPIMILSHHFVPGMDVFWNDHSEKVAGDLTNSPSIIGSIGMFSAAATRASMFASFKALVLWSAVEDFASPNLSIAMSYIPLAKVIGTGLRSRGVPPMANILLKSGLSDSRCRKQETVIFSFILDSGVSVTWKVLTSTNTFSHHGYVVGISSKTRDVALNP